MSFIDEFLERLKDDQWHDLHQIIEKFQLNELKAEAVTNFLAEYNFVKLDKERSKVRLTPPALNFLKKIRSIEEESE